MRGLAEIKLVGKKPSIASMVTNHLPIASLNECIFLLYAAGPLSSFSMYSMPSFVPSHLCHLCAGVGVCVSVCVCVCVCVCVRGVFVLSYGCFCMRVSVCVCLCACVCVRGCL